MDHDGSIWPHKMGPIFTWDWDFNYNVSFAGTIQEIINLAKSCHHLFGFLSHPHFVHKVLHKVLDKFIYHPQPTKRLISLAAWRKQRNEHFKYRRAFWGKSKKIQKWCPTGEFFGANILRLKAGRRIILRLKNSGNTTWMEGTLFVMQKTWRIC